MPRSAKKIVKESEPVKLDLSAFESIFTDPFSMSVKDSDFSVHEILTELLSHYGALSGGNYWDFSGQWTVATCKEVADKSHLSEGLAQLSIDSALELGCYSICTLEGDILINGEHLGLSLRKPVARIENEITEISHSTHAFYDLEFIIFMKDGSKLFTCLNEMEISISDDQYKIKVENKTKKRVNQNKLNRFSSLDMRDVPPMPKDGHLPDDKRFDDLDIPQRKKRTPKEKEGFPMNPASIKNDPVILNRIKNLDMNSYHPTNEDELQMQQKQNQSLDTVLGQNLVQTAAQKLGKQNIATQQQVSPSVQKQADKMSFAKAYEFVEDVYDTWKEADAYKQYADTLDLVDKWYHQDSVTLIDDSLMGAFKYVEDLNKASNLARKISELEDEIYKTKSRSTLNSLQKELKQTKKEFEEVMSLINLGRDKLTVGKDVLEDSTTKLEASIESYLDDYMDNNAQWKSVKGKMEKMSKQIETMEALKNKYASHLDLPPLLYRYKDLMATPIPSIMDVENLKINDVDVLYKAWYATMMQYRKALESFNESLESNYNALSSILGVKAKNRSLF